MGFESKDGSGALFKNEDKDTEQHPDYRGNIKIQGQEYWLSAWIKESKAGRKYMSLSAQPKNPPPQQVRSGKQQERFDDDADLPF
jgi:uncharacterized protein (DUF736 family)